MKILRLVSSCGVCPNYGYYSGGVHQCRSVEEDVENPNVIAPFCPLADFPSEIIAGLDKTIKRLTNPYSYTLSLAVMSHVAAKLGVAFNSRGSSLMIPQEEGEPILLSFDYITDIKMGLGAEIHFIGSKREKFVLCPDSKPPSLRRELVEKGSNGEALYQDVRLKIGASSD